MGAALNVLNANLKRLCLLKFQQTAHNLLTLVYSVKSCTMTRESVFQHLFCPCRTVADHYHRWLGHLVASIFLDSDYWALNFSRWRFPTARHLDLLVSIFLSSTLTSILSSETEITEVYERNSHFVVQNTCFWCRHPTPSCSEWTSPNFTPFTIQLTLLP